MVSYKEAAYMLDKAMEALPEGIFARLNGGVNLIEEARPDGKGGFTLGLYHHNIMGRYIEIFYGSFAELYGDIPPMQFERRLKSTLHHELTHHIEGLAGDRSLERWDEDKELLWEALEEAPLIVESLLFADDDDTALAPAAKAIWTRLAAGRCPDIPVESAGIFSAGEALLPDCRKAAEALGADFSGHRSKALTEELFNSFAVIMCMTLAQADELIERFPGSEEKILTLADRDILRPRLRGGWKSAISRVSEALEEETLRLRAHGEGFDIVPLGEDCPGEIIETLARLEAGEFSEPWTADMLRRALRDGSKHFYAAMEGELLGYIGAQLVCGELEIYNVLVAPPNRGRGIGRALVEHLISEALSLGAERISLEVRASNAPAISLYESLGFVEVGRRRGYYSRPREDAILMDLALL